MTTANMITVGALALALLVLVLNVRGWWNSGRKPAAAVPFLSSFAVGALATVCTGGLLGWIAGLITGTANTAGRIAPSATGTDDGVISPGNLGVLSQGGALVVFVATGVWAVCWRSAAENPRRRMNGGLLCGVTLAFTAGVAGLLGDMLVPGVNSIGDPVIAWFSGEQA
ncbi:hypothetical protein D7231_31910 [Streptomyces klenkii]|uniref:Uncharacterized protein n=1 Tax=Streptomyces klenkii TaxID=1420899 RepID=A0A3B0AMC0_9ACTN|nr:hypothetical protein [Streptomyces klenkii]RKN61880.1 hypothetical protein D7231_31910 [Streptomyces klenkii]